jgi:hypothetical protein
LALLEAIQHEFDTARNPQFFEDPKQIISHDLLRARVRGAPRCSHLLRHDSHTCYRGMVHRSIGTLGGVRHERLVGCALFAIEVQAGALRSQDNSRNERAEEDLHWREMANGGVREKV